MKWIALAGILWFACLPETGGAQTINLDPHAQGLMFSALKARHEALLTDSVRWTITGDSLYEGRYMYDGRRFISTFDLHGNWMQTVEQLDPGDLSDNFRLFLLDHYNIERLSDISAIELVEAKNTDPHYRVTIHARDALLFDLGGNPLNHASYPQ